MNKKSQTRLIYGFIFGVILISVSSLYFIGAESFNENNIKSDLIFGSNISRYGKIEIKNQLNDIIASLELEKNTDTCGSSCSAEIEIVMYKDGILIDNVKFLERQFNQVDWIDKSIPYQFYLKTGGSEWLVNDYKTECNIVGKYKNGTNEIKCSQVKSGDHTENNFTYEKYELGTNVKAGTYYVKLEGTRSSSRWIDWQITSQGVLIDFWYTWGDFVSIFDLSGIGGQTQGVAVNGSSIVVFHGEANNTAYVYNMSGNYTGRSWTLTGIQVLGGAWNGSNWFTTSWFGVVYEYDVSGNYIKSPCSLGITGVLDITMNATNMWFANYYGNIYETYLNCTVIHSYAISDAYGISMNASNIFVTKQSAKTITTYDFDGTERGHFHLSDDPNNDYVYGTDLFGEYFYVNDYGWHGPAAVYQYYNAPWITPSIVTTTLNSPVDYYNSSSNLITFNCSANTTSPNGEVLTNISLWLNTTGTWLLNETKDVSGTYNNSIFTKNIPDGRNWGWTCQAYDNSSASSLGINRTFSVNTPPTQSQPLLKTLSGKNLSIENLTCYNQTTYDVDNDAVTNIYNWYKNNQPLTVLNMPFENSAKDYSGKDNHGTIWEASKTTGRVGNALQFDGINDYVEFNDAPSLDITKPITIEAWIKPSGIQAGYARILFKGDGDSPGVWSYGLAYDPTGNYIRLLTYTTNAVTSISPVMNTTTQWYHIVGTYNGSIQRLYINGIEVDSDSQSGNLRNAGKLGIGAELEPTSERYFNGTIDEVKIYPYALSAEQIKQRYEETKEGLTTNSTIISQETTAGDSFMCQVTPNDGEEDGVTLNSTSLSVLWAIEFNVTDSFSGASLNNVIISCDDPNFNQGGDTTNLYGPYGFAPDSYVCTFTEDLHFETTKIFTADNDKVVDVRMSEKGQLTIEEHTWLEAIYNCIILKDCSLYNLLLEINQTVGNIWEHTKPTDQSVITFENVTNKVVDSSHNLTINYTVNIPIKAGYNLGAYLPVRIGYWFLDENNITCYNQGDKPTGVEEPYCQPLVIETIGPMGGSISFIVKLHPSLSAGNYSIKRIIDIDPQGIWTNYGQESIGVFTIAEAISEAGISLDKTGESMPSSNSPSQSSSSGGSSGGGGTTIIKETTNTIYKDKTDNTANKDEKSEGETSQEKTNAGITGGVIGSRILSEGSIITIITILCGTFTIFIIVRYRTVIKLKKKQK